MNLLKFKFNISLLIMILILLLTDLYSQNRQFPYELSKRDYYLIPAGIGLSLISESIGDNVNPITLEQIRLLDRGDVFAWDRCATYYWSDEWANRSDLFRDILVYPTLLSFVPPLLKSEFNNSLTIATMVVESYFLLRGISYLTKASVQRKRPFLYNSNLSPEERFRNDADDIFSFYSGHTAAVFFSATFLSKIATDIYGNNIWTKVLWGSSLTIASLTGYSRIRAGMHFPTDVVAGAIVGFGLGYFIPNLHYKEMEEKKFSINIFNNQVGLVYTF